MLAAYYRQKHLKVLCLIVGVRSVARVEELKVVKEEGCRFTEGEVEVLDGVEDQRK